MICTILITISPPPSPPHWHIPPCYSVGDYWIPLRSPWKQCEAQKFLTLPSPFVKWSLAKIDILHPLIASNVLVISTLRKRDQIFFFFLHECFVFPRIILTDITTTNGNQHTWSRSSLCSVNFDRKLHVYLWWEHWINFYMNHLRFDARDFSCFLIISHNIACELFHCWTERICKLFIFTSIFLYMKPAADFRSSGCCTWSESLSWHKTLSFFSGSMFIDVHLSSIAHQFLQWLFICIPIGNEMFFKTWPTNAYPVIGFRNLSRLQPSVS